MKTSKIAAGGLGIALIAAMTLGGAVSSASAADFYIDTLGDEAGGPYPAGWFTGDISVGTEGTHAFTPDGLELTGKKQILNGSVPTQNMATLVNRIDTSSQNADWYFQLPVFGNPSGAVQPFPACNNLQYTTLVSDQGTNPSGGNWRTTGNICNPLGTAITYPAGTVTTLDNFAIALGGGDYTVLAYGYFWDTAASDTLYWSDYNDGEITSFFTPNVTTVAAPNPIAIGDFTAAGKGVTISGSGFIPFTEVLFDLYPAGGGPAINLGEHDADANGNVSFKYVGPAASKAGTYTIDTYYLINGPDGSEVGFIENSYSSTFVVALAATGSEFNPALFLGTASLLLAGGAIMILRRRTATAEI
jgi:LPXTG-motif cell wall-anchored protein